MRGRETDRQCFINRKGGGGICGMEKAAQIQIHFGSCMDNSCLLGWFEEGGISKEKMAF
jgi:hypothetical protein